jgi:hypothetical protein
MKKYIYVLFLGFFLISVVFGKTMLASTLEFEEGKKYGYVWDTPPASFSTSFDIYITDVNDDHWQGIVAYFTSKSDCRLFRFKLLKDNLSLYTTEQLDSEEVMDTSFQWIEITQGSSENPIIEPLVFALNSNLYDFNINDLISQKSLTTVWSGEVESDLSLEGQVTYENYDSYKVTSETEASGYLPETTTIYYIGTVKPYLLIYQTITIGTIENYTTISLDNVEEKTFNLENYEITEPDTDDEYSLRAFFSKYNLNDLTYEFNASSSHSYGPKIVTYEWDFGDGTTGTGKIVEHSYSSAGSYNVTLTITDDYGKTDSRTMSHTIKSTGSTDDNNNTESSDTPGFEIIIMFCAITILVYLKRKKF